MINNKCVKRFFSILILAVLGFSFLLINNNKLQPPDSFVFAGTAYALALVLVEWATENHQKLLKAAIGIAAVLLVFFQNYELFIREFSNFFKS